MNKKMLIFFFFFIWTFTFESDFAFDIFNSFEQKNMVSKIFLPISALGLASYQNCQMKTSFMSQT